MRKCVQLPNISCAMTKDSPSFSSLSTALFCLHCGWSRCFFLSDIWQAALVQILWVFSHSFPSESWGHRAWGLLCVLGISDNLNCSSSSLRWKSVASGNHKVKWKNSGYTTRPWHSSGPRSKTYQLSNLRIPNTVCPSLILPQGSTLECSFMQTSQNNNKNTLRKQ